MDKYGVFFLILTCLAYTPVESKETDNFTYPDLEELKLGSIKSSDPVIKHIVKKADSVLRQLKKIKAGQKYSSGGSPLIYKAKVDGAFTVFDKNRREYPNLGYTYSNYDAGDFLSFRTYIAGQDGQSNPGNKGTDSANLKRAESMVRWLSMAYLATGKPRFGSAASKLISTWFTGEFAMSPHLRFSQRKSANYRSHAGVINLKSLPAFLKAVALLLKRQQYEQQKNQNSKIVWPQSTNIAFRKWCKEYLSWLTGPELKKYRNAPAPDNIRTWYWAQVFSLNHYLKRHWSNRLSRWFGNRFRYLVNQQIDGHGWQVLEHRRTNAFTYSLSNLNGLLAILEIAKARDINIVNYENQRVVRSNQSNQKTYPGSVFRSANVLSKYSDPLDWIKAGQFSKLHTQPCHASDSVNDCAIGLQLWSYIRGESDSIPMHEQKIIKHLPDHCTTKDCVALKPETACNLQLSLLKVLEQTKSMKTSKFNKPQFNLSNGINSIHRLNPQAKFHPVHFIYLPGWENAKLCL